MFDHPIHSIFVHFPAGLIPTSVIFFILYLFFRKQIFELISILLLNISSIFLLFTIITGLYDWQVRFNGYFIPPIMIKFFLSFIILLLCVLIYVLRKQKSKSRSPEPLYRAYGYISLYLVLLPFVAVVGYFGGELVHHSSVVYEQYNLNEGSKLFFLRCNSCHPYGQGISSALIFPGDSTGAYGSRNLINSSYLVNKSIFAEYIRHPKRMPAFSPKKISEYEAEQIYNFILFLKNGENKTTDIMIKEKDTVDSPKKIEKTIITDIAIDTMRIGKKIFNEYCSNCHPNGGNSIEGSEKYKISTSQKIKVTSKNFIKFLRNEDSRIKNTNMPVFSIREIQDKDIPILQKFLNYSFGKK